MVSTPAALVLGLTPSWDATARYMGQKGVPPWPKMKFSDRIKTCLVYPCCSLYILANVLQIEIVFWHFHTPRMSLMLRQTCGRARSSAKQGNQFAVYGLILYSFHLPASICGFRKQTTDSNVSAAYWNTEDEDVTFNEFVL